MSFTHLGRFTDFDISALVKHFKSLKFHGHLFHRLCLAKFYVALKEQKNTANCK